MVLFRKIIFSQQNIKDHTAHALRDVITVKHSCGAALLTFIVNALVIYRVNWMALFGCIELINISMD